MASPGRQRGVPNHRDGRRDSRRDPTDRFIETPYQINPNHLIMTLYDLDDIAAQLGFEASTREQMIEDEITMEQIESVIGQPRDSSVPEVTADGGG